MPIYEYRCHACNSTQEILQKVNEQTPDICPSCGKEKCLEKLISHTAFHLKGGGWYKDLYASSSNKTESSSPAPSAPACGQGACAATPDKAGTCKTDPKP